MELRQLEYFRQIADTHSFNEAARHLNILQSNKRNIMHITEYAL